MDNKYAKIGFLKDHFIESINKGWVGDQWMDKISHVYFFCVFILVLLFYKKVVVPLVSGGGTFTRSVYLFRKSSHTNDKSDKYATFILYFC